jgi:nitroimidazol reductase NimA-like FMN-containing flavoprotein (pyridoxamine 5'-phosphate oxidase superfamily)
MMRRKDRQIETNRAYELLEKCEYGVLSLVDEKIPYAIPISYAHLENKLYFHGAMDGTKIDIIRKHPFASFVCVGKTHILPEKFSTEYESVIVNGTISVVEDEQERRVGLQALAQKYSPSFIHESEDYIDKLFDRTRVMKLEIASITGKKR